MIRRGGIEAERMMMPTMMRRGRIMMMTDDDIVGEGMVFSVGATRTREV
jgi:hypothetical protein